MKTATQKAMDRAAKQIAKIQENLDAARYADGVSDEDKAAAAYLWETLNKAACVADRGANPLLDGPSRSEQLAAHIASH